MSDQLKDKAEETSIESAESENAEHSQSPTQAEAESTSEDDAELSDSLDESSDEAPKNRRERRAAAAGASDNEEIKDRNRRLRAEAAVQRRGRRDREREAAAIEGLAPGERIDDALQRTAHVTGKFVGSNFKWLQWVVVGSLAAGLGVLFLNYYNKTERQAAGGTLSNALTLATARVLDSENAGRADASYFSDTRPEFTSEAEKLEQLKTSWSSVSSSDSLELRVIGKLGEASALYAERKFTEAAAAYEAVLADPVSQRFHEMRLRAQEGLGFCAEAAGDYEAAIKAFSALADSAVEFEKDLGAFHKARVLVLQEKPEEAKALLIPLDEKLNKDAGFRGPSDYLGASISDLLKRVDPSKINRSPQIDPEMLRRLQEQMSQRQPG